MRIIISNSAGVPIYEQIKDQIRSAIYTGEVKEGEALPSIRQLAKDLRVSVITTTRAYQDLEQEGLVANVQGKGCFVLPQDSQLVRENALRDVEAGIQAAITAAKLGGIAKDEFDEIVTILSKEEGYESST